MRRPTLLGQLTNAHAAVVAGTCAFLVLATMAASAFLLRAAQDRTVEATAGEVINGIVVESRENGLAIRAAADEYFAETRLEGFRFELLDRAGTIVASRGEVQGWDPEGAVVGVGGHAMRPSSDRPGGRALERFRACAVWCGPDHVLRVITLDVLHGQAVRRAAGVLLAALPLAAFAGMAVGRVLFRRRLATLGRLESAVARSEADAGVSIDLPAGTREIATLQGAFNGLLARLGEALSRERRFAQEAAHELRTPLATLRARLEPIATKAPASDAGIRAAAALADVDALDRLVDALLLLARSESAPLPTTPVNLCDLAREAAHRRFLADGEDSRCPEVEAPDEILVRGSEDLLGRAISNLVDNARKFGGPRARIVIRVRDAGERATVSVADDGPGITPADAEHVFERFYRAAGTRAAVDGAGLGLAVVRAIATRHHGTIGVQASDLGGAELLLELPSLR